MIGRECAEQADIGQARQVFERDVRSVSSEAIISGRAAFFAPEIGMTPFSGWPPTMRMRSIAPRSGAAIFRALLMFI